MTYLSRLTEIIDISYKLFCNKVWDGDISIINEATMQLQLGLIIKTIGKQFEFSKDDRFEILLETPQNVNITTKSMTGHARCDIKLQFYEKSTLQYTAYIELKYLKKTENEAVTDNRFSVYKDLENLEQYSIIDNNTICYEIISTDNLNYSRSETISGINIGNGVQSMKMIKYRNKTIKLDKTYTFNWDLKENRNFAFLKIRL